MKYITYEQTAKIFDAAKKYNDNTYAKSSKIETTIGLTSDGTGYEINLPWFEITSGVITNCGTNTYKIPQLFKLAENREGLTLLANDEVQA